QRVFDRYLVDLHDTDVSWLSDRLCTLAAGDRAGRSPVAHRRIGVPDERLWCGSRLLFVGPGDRRIRILVHGREQSLLERIAHLPGRDLSHVRQSDRIRRLLWVEPAVERRDAVRPPAGASAMGSWGDVR